MKTKPSSQSAFVNPRAILSFVLCLIGVLLALIATAVYPGATVLAAKPPHARTLTAPPAMPTGPRPHAKQKVKKGRPANPRPALPRTPRSIAPSAVSTTFVVDDPGDTHNVGPGCADSGGKCTLRAAVEAANADAPNVDAITVPALTIVLTLGELPVTNSMVITGAAGGTSSIVDGNAASTIFHITSNAALDLESLVLQNGAATSGYGGAVYVEVGALTAGGVTLTGNTASSEGGGIYVDYQGSLWLTNSIVTANTATYGAGVYAYGPSNFENDTFGGAAAIAGNHASSEGGGLYAEAATLIENTTFTNNNADSEGGGLFICAPTIINGGTFALNGSNNGYGGAIYQSSYDSTITGTLFSQNGTVAGQVPQEGGAVYQCDETMQLINTTFDGNQAINYGGAIYNDNSLQMIGGTFSNNTAGMGNNYVYGGAFYNSYFASIENVTFTDTVANAGPSDYVYGGLIYNNDYLTMVNVTISGTQNTGYYIYGGVIYNDYFLNMDGVTVTNTTNDTTAAATTDYTYVYGGGIYNCEYLNASNVSFDGTMNLTGEAGNTSYYGYVEGGVLYQDYYASLDHFAMTNTTASALGVGAYIYGTLLYNNDYMTGNIMNMTGSTATADDYIYGAVYNDDYMTLSQATIAQHTATLTGVANYDSAAGFWNDYGPVNFTNVTIANNSLMANGGAQNEVGGIYSDTSEALTLTNCTVAGNSAAGATSIAGGVFVGSGALVTLKNTIVANNTGGDCGSFSISDVIHSAGYNLDSDGTCGLTQVGDLPMTDPMLSALADNGGGLPGLLTLAPMLGSPVIDAGDDNGAPATDERGITRPQGPHSDIGAVEFVTVPTIFANISTRADVETGDNAAIGGFILTGTQPLKVIVRAIGPSLANAVPPVAGALANPTLALYGPDGQIAFNDDWQSTQEADIMASGLAPTNPLESAIILTLPASPTGVPYTAIMNGLNNTTGIGLVEVYDLDPTADSKLANVSTRGLVGTGNNVMIGGIIVTGTGSQNVIVRAIGPSLPVTGALADPTLALYDGNGTLLAMNDNWKDTQEAEIMATGVAPTNDLESAIVMTLPASDTGLGYTAIVSGVNGTTGVALVEFYALAP